MSETPNEATEIVVLTVPAIDWALLEETLRVDSESASFDKDLREQIADSLSRVVDVTEQITTAEALLGELARKLSLPIESDHGPLPQGDQDEKENHSGD
jgi:hypothetical protein